MTWALLALVAVGVVAAAMAYAAGRLPSGALPEAVSSTPATGLPEHPDASDVGLVRFDTAVRGYRMAQVDQVLDVLQDRLAALEADNAALRTRLGPGSAPTGTDIDTDDRAPRPPRSAED